MSKKTILTMIGVFLMALVPSLSLAQSTGNNPPLGSKQNPIKPTSVNPAPANGTSAKGKRGSKTNPIAGSVHPRGTN